MTWGSGQTRRRPRRLRDFRPRDGEVTADTRPITCMSEAHLALDQELNLLHVGTGIERKGHIHVKNVAEGRPRADDAKAYPGVAQPARIDHVGGVATPGAARVKECRTTDA